MQKGNDGEAAEDGAGGSQAAGAEGAGAGAGEDLEVSWEMLEVARVIYSKQEPTQVRFPREALPILC